MLPGLLLMSASKLIHVNNTDEQTALYDTIEIPEYDGNDISSTLSDILSKIDKVGKVKVFLNLTYDNLGDTNKNTQKIEGVIIVAQGGGNPEIQSMIKNVISNTFGVPVHKINVLKMNK